MVAAWKARHAPRVAAWRAGGRRYVGRFAPSPTGPLHAGSLVAALASWLDARAHDGVWRLRIEDVDLPRTVPGAAAAIMETLAAYGLDWDGEVVWQSARGAAYQAAFDRLAAAGRVFPCACTRREIADSVTQVRAHAFGRELVYPGTCRGGVPAGRAPRAWRVRVPDATIAFDDLLLGPQAQHLGREVGDFVLRRADGLWAYQLAVVVDDAAAGVTHVVRGADLLDSTARQVFLCRLLDYPVPQYLHVPVVTSASGEKLSKQTGAPGLEARARAAALAAAWRHLCGAAGAPAVLH
ncbi:MAG: tRNA glutamyl-Q(34) synthetase GluQRS [Burkholderiales bacterium]|nr:tRNA glutamyl-Q(34) synthetase GluQRS [Burkholderiales bacterium]